LEKIGGGPGKGNGIDFGFSERNGTERNGTERNDVTHEGDPRVADTPIARNDWGFRILEIGEKKEEDFWLGFFFCPQKQT
jgi:hypothetical protein